MRRLDCFWDDHDVTLELISDQNMGSRTLVFLGQLQHDRIVQKIRLVLEVGVDTARRAERAVGR